MHQIISRYTGQLIGINIEKPAKFEPVKLVDANTEFITIESPGGRTMHYSARWIVFAMEGEFSLGGGFSKKTPVPLLVQVYQFLVPGSGGGVGVGVAF
ncbi:hypothetical protein CJ179_36510 [Rhodococcus sp. ACS1]|nr:hypothetical protein CJ179_36510 [Rhodococcus sp. ACS1]